MGHDDDEIYRKYLYLILILRMGVKVIKSVFTK